FNRDHNQDIIAEGVHFHSNTTQRRETLIANGVDLRIVGGEKINSEIVYGYGKSVLHSYAAYVVDWARGGPGGMLSGRSHRVAIHESDFDVLGVGITNHTGSSGSPPLGPQISSSVLANIENPPIFVTGALFRDVNGNGRYDASEGGSGGTYTFVDEEGNTFTGSGSQHGGYQIALPPGTYSATLVNPRLDFPLHRRNIVVGDQNVWVNWIYDPNTIPQDNFENNDVFNRSTFLEGANPSLDNLSMHAGDVDYLRIESPGTGQGTVTIEFEHADGDLDLEVLDGHQELLASSNSTTDNESVSVSMLGGATYYIRVQGKDGAQNGLYSINISTASALPPVALSDQLISSNPIGVQTIDILSNDSNPDGSNNELTPILSADSPAAFELNAQQELEYLAPEGYSGIHRAKYHVENERGQLSNTATVSVFVVNFESASPWRNAGNPSDVNDDGFITAIDALLVIYEVNVNPGGLPEDYGSSIFGFVDANGDSNLSAIDALLVIFEVNQGGSAEGEAARLDEFSSGLAGFLLEDEISKRRWTRNVDEYLLLNLEVEY
ncbi:MAG: dockerin type I domain-containing protein, partial [Planctomycetota bacterium]